MMQLVKKQIDLSRWEGRQMSQVYKPFPISLFLFFFLLLFFFKPFQKAMLMPTL